MLRGKSFSELAPVVVAGALLTAMVWGVVKLAPLAMSRWF